MSLYSKIMQSGIPEEWKDTMSMQNSFSDCFAKGWNVPVVHQDSKLRAGTGVFVQKSVKKGEVLRTGVNKKNMIVAKCVEDFPKITETTKYYLAHYCASNKSLEAGGHNEVYIWLPGTSSNHDVEKSNMMSVRTDEGYSTIATRDIESGEELFIDYNCFGEPPKWFKSFIQENKLDSVFKGFNDFV